MIRIPLLPFSTSRRTAHRAAAAGFTLLEILIALSIFAIAFAIVAASFYTTTRAWNRGTQALEGLHEGDFVMDQVVSALRSAAWFRTTGGRYGFWMEDNEDQYPADRISWVASGSALMPPDSPYRRGLHRLTLSIEDSDLNEPGLAVRATSPFVDEDDEDTEEPDPWFVGGGVRGLDCRIWDGEAEDWIDEWEYTNRLPTRVEIALYFDPPAPGQDPIILRRLIDIPVAGFATTAVSRTETRRR